MKRDQSKFFQHRQDVHRRCGTCLWCSEKAAEGHALCARHLKEGRDKYAAELEMGLCTKCGSPNPTGGWACVSCKDEANELRRMRRAKRKSA